MQGICRRARTAATAGALSLLFFGLAMSADASCGSSSCFLSTRSLDGVVLEGAFWVDISYRYVNQSRWLEGRKEVAEVLVPRIDFEGGEIEPDHHREIRTLNSQLQVDLAYGLTDRLTLSASLPLVNHRGHEHFHIEEAEAHETEGKAEEGAHAERFSNQDGTTGLGDVQLGARYALLVEGRDLLIGGLGAKLPTDVYRLRDSDGQINEPTIQPGTGTLDLFATLHYTRQIAPGRSEWFALGSYRVSGENALDYRFGDEAVANLGMSRRVGERITLSLQANGRRTGRDEFNGQPVPSTGATLVNLTPGVRLGSQSGTSLYGFVPIPIYQDVNDAQLAPRLGLVVGVSASF